MAIVGFDGYLAAVEQDLTWAKTGTRTTVATIPFTVFDVAGNPGPGTLAIGNTANGIVPTNALNGYPKIVNIPGTSTHISKIDFSGSVAGRIFVFDRLFAAGAYAYNANTTLASQPSFSSRILNSSYIGFQLWVEAVTAFTGTPSVQINYLDQDGNAGDTGVISLGAALTVGRCVQIPLAAGDCGIQKITQVRGTVATAGTFNVSVFRYLWFGRVKAANDGDIHDSFKTGFKRIFSDSAIYVLLAPDSTAIGLPYLTITVKSG
jgi:hypothetical protein